MQSTVLEDGRTAVYDDGGNLTQIINADGTVYSPDTSIVSDLARQFTGTIGSFINRAFATRPQSAVASNTPAPNATQAKSNQLLIGIALALGVVFLLRLKGA